ncbi:MAG TPA: dynamin family protein [Bryobacteraceae bacterium]|nr:dynamin family protein [Bryobacteraceae bacterium]
MILRTHAPYSESIIGESPSSPEFESALPLQPALDLANELAERYEIASLSGLLGTTAAAIAQNRICVAVFGRFKAGKSSFLNDFIGREILPVGVVPVTAVVTELHYGPRERARVLLRGGRTVEVPVDQIRSYISERENPENRKEVELITVELPELRRFPGLTFVDTPGLESALAHNTDASMNWLPNAGLALVAVSVDPPLSQRDIDLLKNLYEYTPKVAILLTKADLLNDRELAEVVEFVSAQLARNLPGTPQVFPYSTRPGFERFRQCLEDVLIAGTLQRFADERESILTRKMDTLLRECGDYLALSLRSAEAVQSERQSLKHQVIGEREIIAEVKAEIRLVVQHAAAGTRSAVGNRLETYQGDLERSLLQAFDVEFPKWTRSLGTMLSAFEIWLERALRDELTVLSVRERSSFISPLHKVQKQVFRALQEFRDRLSERTMRAFGVPLRTTETGIAVAEPAAPNIRIGNVFDRNWELLSPILPVWMIRNLVRRHFAHTISDKIYQNLSRLSAQWEESINEALWRAEKEAGRRLDELIATMERLVEKSGNERAEQIRADMERLVRARASLDS